MPERCLVPPCKNKAGRTRRGLCSKHYEHGWFREKYALPRKAAGCNGGIHLPCDKDGLTLPERMELQAHARCALEEGWGHKLLELAADAQDVTRRFIGRHRKVEKR